MPRSLPLPLCSRRRAAPDRASPRYADPEAAVSEYRVYTPMAWYIVLGGVVYITCRERRAALSLLLVRVRVSPQGESGGWLVVETDAAPGAWTVDVGVQARSSRGTHRIRWCVATAERRGTAAGAGCAGLRLARNKAESF